jgi:hypothetical protein
MFLGENEAMIALSWRAATFFRILFILQTGDFLDSGDRRCRLSLDNLEPDVDLSFLRWTTL